MSFLNKLRAGGGGGGGGGDNTGPQIPSNSGDVDPEIQAVDNIAVHQGLNEKEITAYTDAALGNDISAMKEAMPTDTAQVGVKKIEAITLTWTKSWLAALLGLYVLCNSKTHCESRLTTELVSGCSSL
jgi:hypothetical protein